MRVSRTNENIKQCYFDGIYPPCVRSLTTAVCTGITSEIRRITFHHVVRTYVHTNTINLVYDNIRLTLSLRVLLLYW